MQTLSRTPIAEEIALLPRSLAALPIFPRRDMAHTLLQKLAIASRLFNRNELLNHSAAAAFFFLLSITPFFLLLIIGFDRYLSAYPDLSRHFFDFLRSINTNLDRKMLVRMGLLNPAAGAVGLLGVLNLLWAGRMVLVAVQRGLGVVFSSKGGRTGLRVNLFSLLLLFLLVLLSLVGASLGIVFKFIQTLLAEVPEARVLLSPVMTGLQRTVPLALTVAMIFLAYRFVPAQRPKTLSSAMGALFCAAAILLLHKVFSLFFSVTRYSMVYGVMGSLILMILWVYFSFLLFFFFAQLVFVTDKFDVLLFERFYLHFLEDGKKRRRTDEYLFRNPRALFRKYLKVFPAGEVLFQEGDAGQDIYFLHRGRIGIYREGAERRRLASVSAGEIFGEMAHLLSEPRIATAIVEEEAYLVVIPPGLFEDLLKTSTRISRNVIQVLTARLEQSITVSIRP